MNILITTAEWKSSLTCMRSLAKRGHNISLISPDTCSPSLHSKFCKEKIYSPKETDKEKYLNFIFTVIQNKKYDLIIPISDLCVDYFSEYREELSKYVKIFLPHKEAIDIARSKDKTYRFAEANGIPIPRTYYPKDIVDIEKIADEISFPCVVKEIKGTGGNGNTYINDKCNLISLFKNMEVRTLAWPVIQEFVEGKFHGFTAICDAGKILDYFIFEVVRQYPKKGGITVNARAFHDKDSFKFSEELIKKLSWTGPIDLDFFIVKNRGFVLLEINPRFSGTTQFAYGCGIDLPYKYLELATKNKCISDITTYKDNIFYRSIFPEEILSCKEDKKYILHFLVNFLRPNTRYDFSLADPSLLYWQIKNAKWRLES